MSRKRTNYSAEFKVKIVLEVLKGEKTLNQIATENNILPKNIINWKKQFLANAEIAMEPSKAVKEYKEQIKELGIKPISTTIADEAHPKYPYKLKDVEINKPNKVWSTDITYIKINGGTVYLAAIIDWYSKAVLSWKISNVMDTDFVMDVLNDALKNHPKPEIFNTDQGSQYTSFIHTQTLKDNGIVIL